MENRQERRVGEETRVATASPEAGTLAGGTASRPLRDGRSCGGVPTYMSLPHARPQFPGDLPVTANGEDHSRPPRPRAAAPGW